MGTLANIGIINKDGTVEVILCTWDGYPSYTGDLLLNHYNSEKEVRKLISLGDISQLRWKVRPGLSSRQEFYNPKDGVTISYKRDRGDTDADARKYESLDEYWKIEGDAWFIEYVYMWDASLGKWKWAGEGKSGLLRRLFKKDCKRKN